jgi:hypothetical protein
LSGAAGRLREALRSVVEPQLAQLIALRAQRTGEKCTNRAKLFVYLGEAERERGTLF